MDRQVDLSTVGMPITGAEEATERARVRSGTLTDLGRLMLWSPSKAPGESSHFSVTTVRGLSSLPPGVEAGQKLTVEERTKVRLLTYTGGGVKQWRSAIFARCEKGNWSFTDKIPIIPSLYNFKNNSPNLDVCI